GGQVVGTAVLHGEDVLFGVVVRGVPQLAVVGHQAIHAEVDDGLGLVGGLLPLALLQVYLGQQRLGGTGGGSARFVVVRRKGAQRGGGFGEVLLDEGVHLFGGAARFGHVIHRQRGGGVERHAA